jgi:serine/threonine-protein kinase RIO1
VQKKVMNEKYWMWRETGVSAYELTPQEALAEAIENNLMKEAYQVIGQGKEAFVCWGMDYEGRHVALKTYKIFRTTHRHLINSTYRTSPYQVIKHFAKLEYNKTMDLHDLKLPVPQPYRWHDYSFSMELIGDETGPSPLLKDYSKDYFDDPSELMERCVDFLYDAFQLQYVHGDFSEHNIILHNEELVVIDFLQTKKFALKDSVDKNSPLIPLTRAYRILQQDVNSILTYFKRCHRIQADKNEVLEYITGDIKNKIDKELELSCEVSN